MKKSTFLKIKAERMKGKRDRERLLELKEKVKPINKILEQIKDVPRQEN